MSPSFPVRLSQVVGVFLAHTARRPLVAAKQVGTSFSRRTVTPLQSSPGMCRPRLQHRYKQVPLRDGSWVMIFISFSLSYMALAVRRSSDNAVRRSSNLAHRRLLNRALRASVTVGSVPRTMLISYATLSSEKTHIDVHSVQSVMDGAAVAWIDQFPHAGRSYGCAPISSE